MNISTPIVLTVFGLSMLFPAVARADDEFDEFRKLLEQGFDSFSEKMDKAYSSFRDKVNDDYADFIANPWKKMKSTDPLQRRKEPEPAPEYTEDDALPEDFSPVTIEESLPDYNRTPQPVPPEPIPRQSVDPSLPPLEMTFYGTGVTLQGMDLSGYSLHGGTSDAYADGWRYLSRNADNLINECLRVRKELKLADWYYLLFLDRLSERLTSEDSNEATLLHGFLLNQSGYDIRFASVPSSGKLILLVATDGILYGRSGCVIDGQKYYGYTPMSGQICVCDFKTPGERVLSLAVDNLPQLDYAPGNPREVKVKNHPELVLKMTTNKNLVDMLGDYPDSALTDSPYSRWSAQGNFPASKEMKEQVYPVLKEAVKGMSQYDAVQLLLKVAQSFPYEYDETVWGDDRVFWMDESWHYPYSDCEDHAINFSRLVRDIVGIDACLICYPEHLAACVAITDGTGKGDYVTHGGKKYIVCDATYFYAPAGKTAPSCDNASARLIPLLR